MNFGIYIIIIIIVYCIFLIIKNRNEKFLSDNGNGYFIKHNLISQDIIQEISNLWDQERFKEIYDLVQNNKEIKEFIYSKLPSTYSLMDYIFFLGDIKNANVLHTCHRDENSSKFLSNLKNTSYTIILYIDDMKNCLDIIPDSQNHHGIYAYDNSHTFICGPGSIIMFDGNMVHSGSLESNASNRRIQLKVCHEDDLETLGFFNGYHKRLNKPNNNTGFSKYLQKKITCQFPVMADLTQGNKKDYIKGDIGFFEKIFSKLFYGSGDYYKLNDAF